MTLRLFLAKLCWPNPLFALSFLSSASCAHPSQEGFWWTEGSCSDGMLSSNTHYQGCCHQTRNMLYAKVSQKLRCPLFKCDLQSRVTCINFWTPFRAANNRINTVQMEDRSVVLDMARSLELKISGSKDSVSFRLACGVWRLNVMNEYPPDIHKGW